MGIVLVITNQLKNTEGSYQTRGTRITDVNIELSTSTKHAMVINHVNERTIELPSKAIDRIE